jgi:hypothetical protein
VHLGAAELLVGAGDARDADGENGYEEDQDSGKAPCPSVVEGNTHTFCNGSRPQCRKWLHVVWTFVR